jgi:NAD-dependent deacetylase
MKSCSVKDPDKPCPVPPENPDLHIGDKAPDGGRLRPFIVRFGEAVPKIEEAIAHAESSDIFVVTGTSLNVYPAAGLLHYVRNGQPVFLIDPKEVNARGKGIEFIRTGASEGIQILAERLKTMR